MLEGRAHEIKKGSTMHIIELSIEHLTGKEAIELVRARKASSPKNLDEKCHRCS